MNSPIWKKMKSEIHSILGLSVVNITFSAITLAIGIVLIINNIFNIYESSNFFSISLFMLF